jgi:hypothetical protein
MHEPGRIDTAKMFLFAHSGWRQSILITMMGGTGHSPAVLRQSLETSLYGYLFHRDPIFAEYWHQREVDPAALNKFRNGAQKRAFALLSEQDEQLSKRIRKCLDDLVSFGAHANFLSVEPGVDFRFANDEVTGTMNYHYLRCKDSRTIPYVLACRVAELSLLLFGAIYPERTRFMGFNEKLQNLRLEIMKLIAEFKP